MDKRSDSTDLPAALERELRQLYAGPGQGQRGAISREHDASILAAARRAGAEAGTSTWRRWRTAGAIGIAAAVAVAAGVLWNQFGTHGPATPYTAATARRESAIPYARTGDIRDAFYVARRLKTHQALERGWDVNGDGVVDDADVNALAMAAVKVAGNEKEATQ